MLSEQPWAPRQLVLLWRSNIVMEGLQNLKRFTGKCLLPLWNFGYPGPKLLISFSFVGTAGISGSASSGSPPCYLVVLSVTGQCPLLEGRHLQHSSKAPRAPYYYTFSRKLTFTQKNRFVGFCLFLQAYVLTTRSMNVSVFILTFIFCASALESVSCSHFLRAMLFHTQTCSSPPF